MGRPSTNTVEYFPHFTNASEKRTIVILEGQYGIKGYSFWFKLLEYLGKSEGHFFDARKQVDLEFLVRKCGVDLVSGTEILDKLAFLDAIDPELWGKKIIWSQNFVKNLQVVYSKRGRALPLRPNFCDGNNNEHDKLNVISDTVILADNNNLELPTLETPQSRDSKVEIVKNIYTFWNSKNIIVHQKLTDKMERKIKSVLRDYDEKDILKAIDNYAEIMNNQNKYWWTHKYILVDFLQRGLDKFLDSATPLENFGNKKSGGQNGLRKELTNPATSSSPLTEIQQ